MNMDDYIELSIQISAEDTTENDVDAMTRQLLIELKEIDVRPLEVSKGDPLPAGSKGDPMSIGSTAVEVLPVAIPGVITLVQAWMARGRGRTVKFKGKGIEFEGSAEELQKLLATLEKGRKKK
jgi:hypothetical protein